MLCRQVDDDGQVTLIDFPQMISTSHANASEWFARDADCLYRSLLRISPLSPFSSSSGACHVLLLLALPTYAFVADLQGVLSCRHND